MKNFSELVKLRLITPTQSESGFELIELRLIASTQTENYSELVELSLIAPTQMRFYIKQTFFFLLSIESDHFRRSTGLSQHSTINS